MRVQGVTPKSLATGVLQDGETPVSSPRAQVLYINCVKSRNNLRLSLCTVCQFPTWVMGIS